MRFYYTFGTDENFPYRGGWVEVIADNRKEADEKYIKKYPLRDNCINCAGVYSETEWKETGMFKTDNNHGHGCYEIIE